MIDCVCWKCEHKDSVPDDLAGASHKCPQCGATIPVPRLDGPAGPSEKPTPEKQSGGSQLWAVLLGFLLMAVGLSFGSCCANLVASAGEPGEPNVLLTVIFVVVIAAAGAAAFFLGASLVVKAVREP